MLSDYIYIKRCLELAAKGMFQVAPNPMVGAVLVYKNHIIGEGWHQKYGQAHAEVNCINNVATEDKHLIKSATMYVSLEPCSHHGKTPPCVDLIIHNQIKKVVIGCVDAFTKVNGGGIKKLQNAGIETVLGDWQQECKNFNKRFFTFHEKKKPYIILKWAQTTDNKIAPLLQYNENERLLISNEYSNRLVHKWRSEEVAIMVGKNTALVDNPSLTNRYWYGNNPARIVIDKKLELPASLSIFNDDAKVFIFNQLKEEVASHVHYIKISFEKDVLQQIMQQCFQNNIQSVLVEGGAQLIQSLINEGLWDECRVITNTESTIDKGLNAPILQNAIVKKSFRLLSDNVVFFENVHSARYD